jgi:hypothetical protein
MDSSNNHSTNSLYNIPKLDGSNWSTWKMRIEAILDERGFTGIVDGTDAQPGK